MLALQLVPRAFTREGRGGPRTVSIRLSLRLGDKGSALVCETAPDPELADAAWRLLPETCGSMLMAERIDEFGHLVDSRGVSVQDLDQLFGAEIRDSVLRRIGRQIVAR